MGCDKMSKAKSEYEDVMSINDAYNIMDMIHYAEENFPLNRNYEVGYTTSHGYEFHAGTRNCQRYVRHDHIYTTFYYDDVIHGFSVGNYDFMLSFYTKTDEGYKLTAELIKEVIDEDREGCREWDEDDWHIPCSDLPQ